MKKEIDEIRLHRKLNELRTTRKKLLVNPGQGSIEGLLKLRKTIERLTKEWIIDGHSRVTLFRLDRVLVCDIMFLEEVFQGPSEGS